MNKFVLKSFDIYFELSNGQRVVTAPVSEAIHIITLPSFAGLITKIVPNYELSEVSEE